jgi:hypothetical protein
MMASTAIQAPSLPDRALLLLLYCGGITCGNGNAVMIIGDDCGASALWQALGFKLLRFQMGQSTDCERCWCHKARRLNRILGRWLTNGSVGSPNLNSRRWFFARFGTKQ